MAGAYNLAEHLLDRHLREGWGDKAAIVCEDCPYTYAELAEQACRVANGLLELGVNPGDRVVLLLPDGPEFVASFLGCVRMGAVAVPTNTGLRSADYDYLLRESAARVTIVDSRLWPEVEPAVDGLSPKPRPILTGERLSGATCWRDWLAGQPGQREPAATTPEDVAFWLWTSGSTGPPKAAPHRHGDAACCCAGYARGVLGFSAADTALSASKLFHAYGLGNSLLFTFDAGGTAILHPGKPTPRAVLELLKDQPIETLADLLADDLRLDGRRPARLDDHLDFGRFFLFGFRAHAVTRDDRECSEGADYAGQ